MATETPAVRAATTRKSRTKPGIHRLTIEFTTEQHDKLEKLAALDFRKDGATGMLFALLNRTRNTADGGAVTGFDVLIGS
jgi:hypothetical protein